MEDSIYDLAIVGAGIAGLSAARRAIDLGLRVVVLEATDQIGGRIRTITGPDGLSWDAGAHWLLQPAINPLVSEAERLGVRVLRQWRAHDRYWLDGRWLTDVESDAVWLDIDDAESLARELSADGEDATFAELINPESGALGMVETILTHQYGESPTQISAIDRSRHGVFEGDWPVTDGFGHLVHELYSGVPVRLGAPVSVIDWGSDPIRIEAAGEFDRGAACAGDCFHRRASVRPALSCAGSAHREIDCDRAVADGGAGQGGVPNRPGNRRLRNGFNPLHTLRESNGCLQRVSGWATPGRRLRLRRSLPRTRGSGR